MICGGKPDSTAILWPSGQIRFGELAHRIQERRALLEGERRTRASVATLEATPDLGFVVNLLAHLEAGLPLAILAPEWAPRERAERLGLLDRAPHPDTALILFTSGSTGAPKAVQLSEPGIQANVHAVAQTLDFGSAAAQTLFLPLSYSFGLLGQLLPALALGVPTRLLGSFAEARSALREGASAAHGMQGGMLSGVPSHWAAIVGSRAAHDPPFEGWTHLVSAGAYLPPRLRREVLECFPGAVLYCNYGQTEAGPRVLSHSSRGTQFFSEVTGYPVPGIKVRVNEREQLEVSGPQLMLGYLGGDAGSGITEGWLSTGDLASVAPDGAVTIRGRQDDLFKCGGERMSAAEIERALRAAPGVRDAAVSLRDDPVYGARIAAFLVADSGQPPSAQERRLLIESLRSSLSARKLPREFHWLPSLPSTPNGKLDRGALKSLFKPSAEKPLAGDSRILEALRKIGVETPSELTETDDLAELGLDSLGVVLLVSELERTLDIRFPGNPLRLQDLSTLRKIHEFLAQEAIRFT